MAARCARCVNLSALIAIPLLLMISPLEGRQAQKGASREVDSSPVAARIDRVLRETVAELEPGMAVIVKHRGRTVLRAGYGMADLELGVKVDPGMVFRIGSVTKQVTALAVMMLVENGRLSLEDPVNRYVPQLPERFSGVRIKHLLSHTSGIPDYMQTAEFDTLIQVEYHDIVNEELDLARLLKIIAESELELEPGEACSYSNSNYFLLARVLEEVSGVSFFEFIQSEICGPAGMVNTYYTANAMFVPGRVPVYVEYEGEVIKSPHGSMGSTLGFGCGGLWSTVDDMAAYNTALDSGLLVSHGTLARMSAPFVLNDGSHSRHGFGWQTGRIKGREIVFHGGDYAGYSALIMRVPSEDIFIAMLTNDGRTYAFNLEMPAKKIAALLFNDPFPEWRAIPLPPEDLERFVGTYRINESSVREFLVEDGRTYTSRDGRPKLEVFPASDTTFFYTVCLHYLEFELDDNGVPTKMILHRDTGDDQVAVRIK